MKINQISELLTSLLLFRCFCGCFCHVDVIVNRRCGLLVSPVKNPTLSALHPLWPAPTRRQEIVQLKPSKWMTQSQSQVYSSGWQMENGWACYSIFVFIFWTGYYFRNQSYSHSPCHKLKAYLNSFSLEVLPIFKVFCEEMFSLLLENGLAQVCPWNLWSNSRDGKWMLLLTESYKRLSACLESCSWSCRVSSKSEIW